jgi:hypothetical protein
MGGACCTHRGDRNARRVSFGKQLQEDLGVDGRKVKIGLKRTECDVVRWIYVAEDRGNGRSL